MKRIAFAGIVSVIVIGTAAWGPCVPAARAAPLQDQPVEAERIGIHLNVVVTQSVEESETGENPGSRMWRFAAMTTNGQSVEVQGAATGLFATPFRLEDGRIAVDFDLMVVLLNEPGTRIIQARADEVLLEDDAPTVVTAFTDETGRAVEVTFTATAGTVR